MSVHNSETRASKLFRRVQRRRWSIPDRRRPRDEWLSFGLRNSPRMQTVGRQLSGNCFAACTRLSAAKILTTSQGRHPQQPSGIGKDNQAANPQWKSKNDRIWPKTALTNSPTSATPFPISDKPTPQTPAPLAIAARRAGRPAGLAGPSARIP